MDTVLQIEKLSHTYSVGTPFEKTAVRDVDFSIQKGEFVALIGHTGSGKSTLIQHFNGLLKPSSGRVLLGGEDIFADKARTRAARFRVGLVFQYPEHQLFEETVYKDIAFGPKNMGLSPEQIEQRVHDAADAVGLSRDSLQRSPFELSGGQKRRVALAGVFAMEPEIVVLDEPMAGLDPAGRAEILAFIRDYHQTRDVTVLFVTHSMEDAAHMAERIVVMHDGGVLMQGRPDEIFARAEQLIEAGLDVPQVTQVFLQLRQMGLAIDTSVYTVEQAVQVLRQRKEGSAC